MTSTKNLLLRFLLFATPCFLQNQGFDPVTTPSWYISSLNLHSWVDRNDTNVSGSLWLFRSGRRSFTSWKIYNIVSCSYSSGDPDTPLKDGWMGCQEYPDAPEGEKQLSPDLYERLKWRLVNLKLDNVTSMFEAATVQVVNAIPVMVSNLTDLEGEAKYMMKAYSANFTINSGMEGCKPFQPSPRTMDCQIYPRSECSCKNDPGYIDPSLCTASCNYLNAPVTEWLHQSDEFKNLFWNLDTNPMKGPQPDLCGIGIRNCVPAINWAGTGLK